MGTGLQVVDLRLLKADRFKPVQDIRHRVDTSIFRENGHVDCKSERISRSAPIRCHRRVLDGNPPPRLQRVPYASQKCTVLVLPVVVDVLAHEHKVEGLGPSWEASLLKTCIVLHRRDARFKNSLC